MPEAVGLKPHRELQRRLKRGYRLVQAPGGHYQIKDFGGKAVRSNGRVISLPATPAKGQFNKRTMLELEQAGVLRSLDEHRARKQKPPADTTSARELNAERDRARQAEVDELNKRLTEALKPVGGIEQPGMSADVAAIGGLLADEESSRLTANLLQANLFRVEHHQPITSEYADIWTELCERLEQAESTSDEFFSLLRKAKGLPDLTQVMRLQNIDGDWPFHNELIPLEQLFVDHSYQRPQLWPEIRKMAMMFDPTLVGNLDVSHRSNGTNAIMDGQQRFEAMRRVGKTACWCSVYTGLDLPAEANFFIDKNTKRKSVQPYWTFRARITAGNERAIELEKTVARHGYRVVSNSGEGHDDRNISAVAALEAAQKRGMLTPTLKALRGGFGLEGGTNGGLIRGLSVFFHDLPDAEVERVRGLIEKRGPNWFVLRARETSRGYGGIDKATLRVLFDEYNRGLPRADKLRLP